MLVTVGAGRMELLLASALEEVFSLSRRNVRRVECSEALSSCRDGEGRLADPPPEPH